MAVLLLLGVSACSLYSRRRPDRAVTSVLQANFYWVQLHPVGPAPAGAEATG